MKISEINKRAEFIDKKLEEEYFQAEVLIKVNSIRYSFLIWGFIFFLVSIADYVFYRDLAFFTRSAITRCFVFLYAIFMFFLLKKIKSSNAISLITSAFWLIMAISYISLFVQKNSQGLLQKAMAITIIILLTTIIQTKWVYLLITELLIVLLFFSTLPFYGNNIDYTVIVEIAFYLTITIFVSLYSQHKVNYHHRKQYLEELKLVHTSRTDELTQIANRRSFEDILNNWCSSPKSNGNFALILFDIDHFKRVNDTYGHQAGDIVLVECAAVVNKYIRKSDLFARWGGEEFVILLADTSIDNATYFCERIRLAIEEYNFTSAGNITCSFGIACHTPCETADSLVKRADKLVYHAKQNGRNRISIAE